MVDSTLSHHMYVHRATLVPQVSSAWLVIVVYEYEANQVQPFFYDFLFVICLIADENSIASHPFFTTTVIE